jgi:hypothetical protein
MAVVDLVHPDVTYRIPVDRLVTQCRQFLANQELTREPYRVQSAVAADAFRAFVAVIEGNAFDITEGNSAELSQLCEEFGFDGLTAQLSLFQPSAALRDVEARRRISALEDRWQQSERQIAELRSDSIMGPIFGCISVSSNSNTNTHSSACQSEHHTSTHPCDPDVENLFMDPENFTVKEIEIFQIAD